MHRYTRRRANKIIFLLIVFLLWPTCHGLAELPPEEEGICVRVRIEIDQDIAITRTGFRATLEINNSLEGVALESLAVALEIQNAELEPANDLFVIGSPELTGIGDIDGNGVVDPGSSARAVWTIIPTRDAAPDYPVRYLVGGTLSYIESGTAIDIPLFPAVILVKPDPQLVLNYFLVRDVYGDDPFTAEKEPAEPFPLGLIMTNQGKGTAHNVRIISSQPAIIENEDDLLVDFEIIGTQVNGNQVLPELNVNLGRIDPAQSAVVQWLMIASLQGEFIEYSATFAHIDDAGDTRVSLIEDVGIHETLHAVRMDVPVDDYRPDFLVNDVPDPDHLPDTLYSSDGTTAVVNVGLDPVVAGEINPSSLEVTLSADTTDGWIYIKAEDPGQEVFALERVVRSDGREIMVSENAWTTHRTIRPKGQAPYREHKLHLLDFVDAEDYEYTLIYQSTLSDTDPPQTEIRFSGDARETDGRYYILPDTSIYSYVNDVSAVTTFYRLDADPDFQAADLITIPETGEHKIDYYSIDSARNQEIPKAIVVYVGSTADRDGDGLPDTNENNSCTGYLDADTDDDGILDGVEDANQNGVVDPGETNPCDSDTDHDGIPDGTELGYMLDDIRQDTNPAIFQPDLDPSTQTDPRDADSDKDGYPDGEEDPNYNGCVDVGEADPSNDMSLLTETRVSLKTGLNLIAIPSDTSCKSELNDWLPMIGDDAEIEAVMAYNRQTGLIATLLPEDESNPNFVLEGGDGLMVYARQPTDIKFASLLCEALEFKEGINIMGFSCPPAGYSAFQFLGDLGSDSVTSIQRHGTDTGRFETAGFDESGQPVGMDFLIVPGEGYLIYMKQEVTDFGF